VYEVTIIKGLSEDSIKCLAALHREMNEFRAEQAEHNARMDMRLDHITAQLAVILDLLPPKE